LRGAPGVRKRARARRSNDWRAGLASLGQYATGAVRQRREPYTGEQPTASPAAPIGRAAARTKRRQPNRPGAGTVTGRRNQAEKKYGAAKKWLNGLNWRSKRLKIKTKCGFSFV